MELSAIAHAGPWLLHAILFVWLIVCAVQDWRHQEVSNWLTLPPFILAVFHALERGGETLALTAITFLVFLTARAVWRAQGAADIKVLVVLASFWPQALYAALLMTAVWSVLRILRRKGKEAFAGIPPMTIGAMLVLVFDQFPGMNKFIE